jgi:hypothetical protein
LPTITPTKKSLEAGVIRLEDRLIEKEQTKPPAGAGGLREGKRKNAPAETEAPPLGVLKEC